MTCMSLWAKTNLLLLPDYIHEEGREERGLPLTFSWRILLNSCRPTRKTAGRRRPRWSARPWPRSDTSGPGWWVPGRRCTGRSWRTRSSRWGSAAGAAAAEARAAPPSASCPFTAAPAPFAPLPVQLGGVKYASWLPEDRVNRAVWLSAADRNQSSQREMRLAGSGQENQQPALKRQQRSFSWT